MTIAKKYAQQYMPNGEVSLEQVIQAAIDEAAQSAAVPVVGDADRDQAVMRASIVAYKEARNGIERHPGNTSHENAAWEWGRKDGGWENKK